MSDFFTETLTPEERRRMRDDFAEIKRRQMAAEDSLLSALDEAVTAAREAHDTKEGSGS